MFVVYDGTRFSIDPYESEVSIDVFSSAEEALLVADQNNDEFNGLMPDPDGPGLIAPRPWKAYELVEVNHDSTGQAGQG